MIAVTGATGQLGRLTIASLLRKLPADQIVAVVRTPSKAADLAALGVNVREGDYNNPESLRAAFAGADRVLIISGSELGQRVAQHKSAIDAAKSAGAKLIAYTSLLNANTGGMLLAEEHLATEAALKASGTPYAILRNGWYIENHTAGIPTALQHGALAGASGEGRFASAARADYADAAATVLTGSGHENKVYELAGDTAYTRAQFAAELSKQAGKQVAFHNLPEAEYEKILASFLPPALAHILADSDAKAGNGALDSSDTTLSKLIGRPTTDYAKVIAASL